MDTRETRVLVVSETLNPLDTEVFRWLADKGIANVKWTVLSTNQFRILKKIRKPFIARYLVTIYAALIARFSSTDVVVTFGPHITLWTGLFLKLLGVNTRHLAWGFTSTMFDDEVFRFRRFARFGLNQVDRFIVFSHLERQLYPKMFGLLAKRFEMLPFSIKKPVFDEKSAPLIDGPYVASMGREGRDFATLIEAFRYLPDIKLVIISSPNSVEGTDLPANVTVKFNLPYQETMNIAKHATCMVIPLASKDVAAGHMTLLTQYLLGVPSVVTRADVMEGYMVDGISALACDPGDAVGMRRQIKRLVENDKLREQIINNGRQYAEAECSETSVVEYFKDYLQDDEDRLGNHALWQPLGFSREAKASRQNP